MKRKNSCYLLLLFMAVALLTTSCRKEGCMVPYAINYDAEAKVPSVLCLYAAYHVIYFDREVSQALLNNGINELCVQTRNNPQYVLHSSSNWASGPDVDDPSCIVLRDHSMSNPVENDYVTIKDVHGNLLWEFSISFDAENPQATQLLWGKRLVQTTME